MTIVLASVLALAVFGFILTVRSKDLPAAEPVSPFAHLDERKAAIYDSLRDAQFEYRLGKLSDDDYQQTKLGLQKELAVVMAEVDRIKGDASLVSCGGKKRGAQEVEGSRGTRISASQDNAQYVSKLWRRIQSSAEVLWRMRQAHEGTGMIRYQVLGFLFSVSLAHAAIDGTVINGTTGKPQPNATVTLYKVGGNGPESIQSVKSGPDGKFLITADAQGPRLVQAAFEGAVYNHMLPPGFPASDVKIEVFQSSNKPGAAHIDQHMVLLEPDGKNLNVSESFVFKNDGKVTYNDPDRGTLRFFVPPAADGKAEVNVLSPGSVPVRRAPQKTSEKDVMKLDFPVHPGESRVDISYTMPFTSPGDFDMKTFYKGNATKFVAPQGVTLKAEGLQNLGQEPRTKATIYGIDAPAVTLQVEGTGALRREEAGDSGGGSNDGGPTLMQILPRLYQSSDPTGGFTAAVLSVKWILLLAFGILGLGFTLLYRKAPDGRHQS